MLSPRRDVPVHPAADGFEHQALTARVKLVVRQEATQLAGRQVVQLGAGHEKGEVAELKGRHRRREP